MFLFSVCISVAVYIFICSNVVLHLSLLLMLLLLLWFCMCVCVCVLLFHSTATSGFSRFYLFPCWPAQCGMSVGLKGTSKTWACWHLWLISLWLCILNHLNSVSLCWLCRLTFILLVCLQTLVAILPLSLPRFSQLPLVYVCLEGVCEPWQDSWELERENSSSSTANIFAKVSI